MKHLLDISNWPRKEHFHFFRALEEPFWGTTVTVDCTAAYQKAKTAGESFFLRYLHSSLVAANETESFRYRIEDDKVWVYDAIHASSTIFRADGTFGFSFIPYHNSFGVFQQHAQVEIHRVQHNTGLELDVAGDDVIHYSSTPWFGFSALSHAHSLRQPGSVPKITFGKFTVEHGVYRMPVSIHVHHALADAYHVGQYLTRFQELLNS